MSRDGFRSAVARVVRAATWRAEKLLRTEHERRVAEWRRRDGDGTLRLNYSLTEQSVVIDAGGYQGQWASDIFAMYRCTIHVYEPVLAFATFLDLRFGANPSIHVHGEGLGGRSRQETMWVQGDASTTMSGGRAPQAETVAVQITCITDVIDDLKLSRVDLLKLNIEGAEYEVLECLLQSGYMERVANLQVQFHSFAEDAEPRRTAIQESLRSTHVMNYCIPFVWESWTLRQ